MDDTKKKVILTLRKTVQMHISLCGEKANYPTEFRDRNGYTDLATAKQLIVTLAECLGFDSEKSESYCFAVEWFAECYDCACEDDQIIANKKANEQVFKSFLVHLEREALGQPLESAVADDTIPPAPEGTRVSK